MNTVKEEDYIDVVHPGVMSRLVQDVEQKGYYIFERVLASDFCMDIENAMYRVREKISSQIGEERLQRAGEVGVLRLMLKCDPFFLKLLEIPELVSIVDTLLSEHAILHVQNGFILPPATEAHKNIFQRKLHMDFPRILNGYLCSINLLFCISDFTKDNGGTIIIPASHQGRWNPGISPIEPIDVECPAGSIIVFDSTLWHAAGINMSNSDRLGINHQFTPPYFKQQIDYVKALGHEGIETLPKRSQQLLGMHARLPSSLEEYYVPQEKRLYRGGQG